MKELSTIAYNAIEDPNYCPYCLRCIRPVRMKKLEPFYWCCDCGAIHDERENVKEYEKSKTNQRVT